MITANNVTIDGVDISGSHQFSGPPWPVGFYITGNNATITNSVIDGAGISGDPLPGTTGPGITGLEISHNLVQGWTGGGIYVSGNGAGSIDHNVFDNDGNGVVTESTSTIISHNAFSNMTGSQVAALPFVDTDVSTYVLDNTFDNNSQQVSIYPNASGAQEITGTAVNDKFKGGDNSGDHGLSPGPLTFHGGQGDDIVFGSEAGDTLTGDAGNDTLFGEGGADTLTGGIGTDAIDGGKPALTSPCTRRRSRRRTSRSAASAGRWRPAARRAPTRSPASRWSTDRPARSCWSATAASPRWRTRWPSASADVSGEAITILVDGGSYTDSVTITRDSRQPAVGRRHHRSQWRGSGWGGVINVDADDSDRRGGPRLSHQQ